MSKTMEEVWVHDDPVAAFRRRLVEQRARSLAGDEAFLRSLRNDFETARRLQRRFGRVWASLPGSPTVFELIAGACGETWDLEDEQKRAPDDEKVSHGTTKKDDEDADLVAAREEGSCGWEHLLQGVPQAGLGELEEAERRRSGAEGGESPKAPAQAQRSGPSSRRERIGATRR